MSALKPPEEWFKQAEYDMGTAAAMLKTRRYIYTVFMCHLAIEKALKGLYVDRHSKDPPKTHDLIYLAKKVELELPTDYQDFVECLNELSVPTRYPDQLEKLLKQYRKERASKTLGQTRELLPWLREKLRK